MTIWAIALKYEDTLRGLLPRYITVSEMTSRSILYTLAWYIALMTNDSGVPMLVIDSARGLIPAPRNSKLLVVTEIHYPNW